MQTLDLIDQLSSRIKYKIDSFPDGQHNIQINKSSVTKNKEVLIITRLTSFIDIEKLIASVASLRELHYNLKISVYITYFLGARSDRTFDLPEPWVSNNYLKSVICPIINSLKFKKVYVLDPHSSSLECCLNNFIKIKNNWLVETAVSDIYSKFHYDGIQFLNSNPVSVIVSPDEGASKKITKLLSELKYSGRVMECSKERDTSGKIIKTLVPILVEDIKKDFIIIDDICDGGGTFIIIAIEIKDQSPYSNIYFIVTHGIFS